MEFTILEEVKEGEVKSFYLKQKATSRCYSTLLIFSPEGIIICGDFCPKMHGVISAFGYGISWFASELSLDYLCEKFLEKEWDKERSHEYLLERYEEKVKEYSEDGDQEKIKAIADRLHYTALDAETYEQFFEDYEWILEEDADDIYFSWYNKTEAEFLGKIQKAFRKFYWEQKEKQNDK